MSNRYSRIRHGAQLNAALTNYIQYLSTPRTPNLNSQGARNLTSTAYVTPFGTDVEADEVASSRVNPDHYTELQPTINGAGTGAQVTDAIGANNVVSIPKFRAARVVLFENATRTVTVATSGVTANRYLSYAGDRRSCPFGRNLENDDQMDAFLQVKAGLLQLFNASAVKRVSLTREVIGVERA